MTTRRMFLSSVSMLALFSLLALAGCQQSTVRGPEGKALTLTVPAAVTLHRGETQTVQVGLARTEFTQGVTVSLANLPAGVTARESSKTVETTAATFVLTASQDAALVTNQAVNVTAKGPNGMATTEQMRLTVKQ